MNRREFTQLCKSRGFARLAPNFYARCIGDGIYQTIFTGFRRYINPESPFYSSTNRKSAYISVSVWSLYTHLPRDFFDPGSTGYGIRPDILIGSKDRNAMFHGIEPEYEMMRDKGFDVLDSVDSQERFLELYGRVFLNAEGGRMHRSFLIAPFLMSGDMENALFEICYSYTHGMNGFYHENHPLLAAGQYEEYCQKEICTIENLHVIRTLWLAWLCSDQRTFSEYLQSNIKRNLKFVEEHNIPIAPDLTIREIPEFFAKTHRTA